MHAGPDNVPFALRQPPGTPKGFRRFFYTSRVQPGLMLSALVSENVEDPSLPVFVFHHGWHQEASSNMDYAENIVRAGFVSLHPDMRGRGFSQGAPDASGYELRDSVDALQFVMDRYPRSDGTPGPYVGGASGGGGNTYSMVAHFPYRFAAALALCGISDYALWYENDSAGCYRDEMDDWIGGSPRDFRRRYENRSGLHLLRNLRMPLYVIHGEDDDAVPVEHAQKVEIRRDDERFGGLIEVQIIPGAGHSIPPEHWLPVLSVLPERHPLGLLPGRNEVYKVPGYVDLGFLAVDLGTMAADAVLEVASGAGGPRIGLTHSGGTAPVARITLRMDPDAAPDVLSGEVVHAESSPAETSLYVTGWEKGLSLKIPGGILP